MGTGTRDGMIRRVYLASLRAAGYTKQLFIEIITPVFANKSGNNTIKLGYNRRVSR